MAKAYHGNNKAASIRPKSPAEILIEAKTLPEDINFIFKIIEAHSHTAFPVKLQPAEGRIGFHTNPDQKDELLNILKNLPRPVKILNNF